MEPTPPPPGGAPPPGNGPGQGPIDLPGEGGAPSRSAPLAGGLPGRLELSPEPEDGPAPEPAQYGPAPEIMETMELTLRAGFQPDAVFASIRDREAPDYFTSLLNFILWSLIGQMMFLVMTFVMVPSTSGLGLLATLITVLAGLIATIPLSFIGGGVLHGLAMGAGGKGDFARSYQTLSLFGCALPVSAVIVYMPVPFVWLVPTIYITYLSMRGVELMHRCYNASVLSTVGLFGLIVTALQFTSYKKIELLQRDLSTRATLFATQGTLSAGEAAGPSSAGLSGPARSPSSARNSSPYGGRPTPGMEMNRPAQSSDAPTGMSMIRPMTDSGAAPQEDSLTLIRGSRNSSGASGRDQIRGPAAQGYDVGIDPNSPGARQTGSIAQTVLNMLNQQMSKNPETLKKMSPQQRAQFQKMLETANQMSKQKGGINDAQTQKMLREMTGQLQDAQESTRADRSRKSRRRTRVPVDENPFATDGQ